MRNHSQPVVLVTGASSGIGRACATRLAQAGYRVFGTSRRAALPGDAPFEMLCMDVDSDESVQQGVGQVVRQAGRLDVVLNNAGVGIAGAVEDTSIEEAKAQFETNFFGVVRVCRAGLPIMRQQHSGYIINISSIGGLIGIPFQALYSASKFAIEGFTEALRVEVKPFGIKVVLIEPGDMRTGFTAHRRKTAQSQTSETYRQRFHAALQVMEHDEINGPSPDAVARLLTRILNTPSPRLRYTAGPPAEQVAVLLKKFVPASLFEWGLMKYYQIG